MSDADLIAAHGERPVIVDANSRKIPDGRLVVADGLFLTLDLHGRGRTGWSATARAATRGCSTCTQIGAHRPRDYWDLVYREEDAPRVVLEPEEFYLLISSEAVRIPPEFAAEMSAYAEASGELRSHYAGLLRPGLRPRPERSPPAEPRGARGARPRRPVHGRAAPARLQAHLRAGHASRRRSCTARTSRRTTRASR